MQTNNYQEYLMASMPFNKMTEAQTKAAEEELRDIWRNHEPDEAKKITAAMLTTDITRKYQETDLAAIIQGGQPKVYQPGDTIVHKTVKGLHGVKTTVGGYAENTAWSAEFTELTPAQFTVNPKAHLTALQGGRVGSLAELQAEAISELRNVLMKNIWDSAKAAISGSTAGQDSDNYLEISTANWEAAGATAKTAINHAIKRLADNGGANVILGRQPAVAPISDLVEAGSTFSPEEYQRFGKAGLYRNIPIVELANNPDRAGTQRIDSSNVFVIGNGAVATYYRGDIKVYPGFDPNTQYVNFVVVREYVTVITDQTKIYQINIT